MLRAEEEVQMTEWKTLKDIFSQTTMDPVANYSDMITSIFFPKDLLEPFITTMINNGHETIVAENIESLNIDKSLEIAEQNPKFKEILLKNFARAISNSDVSDKLLNLVNMEDKSVILNNWEAIAKRTENSWKNRVDFISILNSTEEGKAIIDSQFSTLFYGNYVYNYLIDELIKNELVSKDKIAGLILDEPTRMLSENLEGYCSRYDITTLLEMTDEILTTTQELDPLEVQKARISIENVMIEKFDKLLDKSFEQQYNEKYEPTQKYYDVGTLQLVKSFFRDKDKMNAQLAKSYEKISQHIKPEDTIDFLNLYSEIDVEMKPLDVGTAMSRTFCNIQDPNLQWAISGLAKELLQDQELTLDKMQIYGQGNFSKTIKIGEYVLKVGDMRRTPVIKNNKRMIQPLFRRVLEGENGEEVFIELQNLVDKNWYKGLTEKEIKEELYKVYSDVRDSGSIWTDARKENVGRLLKPNTGIYSINGQKLKGEDVAKGYIEPEKSEEESVLGKGELVIIDTDYSFDPKQKEISGSQYSLHKEFEERYRKEKMVSKEVATSSLLTSALKLSEFTITHEDVKRMADSVNQKSKGSKEEIKYKEDAKER